MTAKGYTLNLGTLKEIEIPIITIQEQKTFINSMRKHEVEIKDYKRKIASISNAQGVLVSKLLNLKNK